MAELPVPDLDDLRFQPLVDAAKRALPQRAPEWTDHNVSDPGVTLIEACAARVDQLGYRAGRMTARQRLALLRLMGITPLPASPLRVLVAFGRPAPATGDVEIPAGTEVRTTDADPVVLTTTAALVLADGQDTGTVEAVERPLTVRETLGTSTGDPAQRFAPSRRPWRPGTPVPDPPFGPPMTVLVDGTAWPPVRTFAHAGPTSQVHWWDDASAEVVFGPDPQHGVAPPKGATIGVEYTVHRGSRAALPAGTPLTVTTPPGLSAEVREVAAAPQDAEDWEQALRRAGLGLAPLRRAVTAADHEQLVGEHVGGLARVRVTALTRPTDSRVPLAFRVPPRPAETLACAVVARDPHWAVHYYPKEDGGVAWTRVKLEGPDGEDRAEPTTESDDAVPPQVTGPPDAVIRFAEDQPRLWFFGDSCYRDGAAAAEKITVEFPGLPKEFGENLDAVSVLADSDTTCELFFFKGETFYHRPYTYTRGDRMYVPQLGGRGVRSLIVEAFPGLSPECRRSPDAVAVHDGVFYVMKGARTEPALWRREDAPLHVLLVPRTDGDPEVAFNAHEFDVPAEILRQVADVVGACRLLGDRLHVGPPRYHSFGIEATVRPWAGTTRGGEDTADAAERALRRFFHPTAGGPDGRGWPWGRRVHAGDVLTALERVPEVRSTVEVVLTLGDGTGRKSSVEVSDSGLVRLDHLAITVTNAQD